MKTVAQFEHAPTFTDPLPAEDTLDRLEDLCRRRRSEITLAKTRRMQIRTFDDCSDYEMQASDRRALLLNQLTQAELRRAEIEIEIINVAALLCAEHAAAEMETQ